MESPSTSAPRPATTLKTIEEWAHSLGIRAIALRAYLTTKAVLIDADGRCLEQEVRAALQLDPGERIRPKRWSGYYAFQRGAFADIYIWEGMLHVKPGTLRPALTAVGAIPTHFFPKDTGCLYNEGDVVRAATTALGMKFPVVPEGDRLFYGPRGALMGTWDAWKGAVHELATAPPWNLDTLEPGRGRLAVTDGKIQRFVRLFQEQLIHRTVLQGLKPALAE